MRTELIVTNGPSCDGKLINLVGAGASIVRFNFSHATYDYYEKVSGELKKSLPNTKILVDLQGPRMRLDNIPEEGIVVHTGDKIDFSTDILDHGPRIDNESLHEDIKIGDDIFFANGEFRGVVDDINDQKITVAIKSNGRLRNRKGVNTPSTVLQISGLTEKDILDIENVRRIQDPDYVAVSFVQSPQDIKSARELAPNSKIVAKIESKISLNNIDEIVQEADVVMVARGDLGIEIPFADVPRVQRRILQLCRWHDTPSIVATQLLISMVERSQPTRAEVSDIVLAVRDGADALMLSDETAVGRHPKLALETLKNITETAEEDLFGRTNPFLKI